MATETPAASNWIACQLYRRIATLEQQVQEREREVQELKQALARKADDGRED